MEAILNFVGVSALIGVLGAGVVLTAQGPEMRVSTSPRYSVIALHQAGGKNFVMRKDNVGGTCWLEVSDDNDAYAVPITAAACLPTPIN